MLLPLLAITVALDSRLRGNDDAIGVQWVAVAAITGTSPCKPRRRRAGDLRLRPTEGTAEPRKEHSHTDGSFPHSNLHPEHSASLWGYPRGARLLTSAPLAAAGSPFFGTPFFGDAKKGVVLPGTPGYQKPFNPVPKALTTRPSKPKPKRVAPSLPYDSSPYRRWIVATPWGCSESTLQKQPIPYRNLTNVDFNSVYFSNACSDLSRPFPDCL